MIGGWSDTIVVPQCKVNDGVLIHVYSLQWECRRLNNTVCVLYTIREIISTLLQSVLLVQHCDLAFLIIEEMRVELCFAATVIATLDNDMEVGTRLISMIETDTRVDSGLIVLLLYHWAFGLVNLHESFT